MQPLPDSVIILSEQIGSFIEYWGFKQIHGSIWTLIFLSPEPVDANYLIDNLKVSKALISISIKDLLKYNVITEVKKTEPGTQKYSINPNISDIIADVLINREATLLEQIKGHTNKLMNSKALLQNNDTICSHRAKDLHQMVTMAETLLETMIAFRKVDLRKMQDLLTIIE